MNHESNDSNIPLYNDEQINKDIKKRKKKEEYERKKQIEEQLKNKKKEIKMSRYTISEIPDTMLFTLYIMIAIIGVSFYTKNIQYIFYSVIGIIITIYLGKRSKFKIDENLNILIWNISQTINDFIHYKLKLDFFTGSEKRTKNVSSLFIICLLLSNSTNILYGIFFILTIIVYLISFANRDFIVISKNANKIAIGSILGFLVKTIIYSLLYHSLTIDFMNIIIANLFGLISFYTKNFHIYEPE